MCSQLSAFGFFGFKLEFDNFLKIYYLQTFFVKAQLEQRLSFYDLTSILPFCTMRSYLVITIKMPGGQRRLVCNIIPRKNKNL